MPFSYYPVSVAFSDSAASTSRQSSSSFSTTGEYISGGATLTYTNSNTRTESACPTRFFRSSSSSQHAGGGGALALSSQSVDETYVDEDTVSVVQSYTYFFEGFSDNKESFIRTLLSIYKTTSVSDFPFVALRLTLSTSETFAKTTDNNATGTNFASGATNTSSSSSTTFPFGPAGKSAFVTYSTFTFTSTYGTYPSTTTLRSSSVVMGTQTESTTFASMVLEPFYSQTKTATFTSTRVDKISFFTAPVNISKTFELQHFRPITANTNFLSEKGLARAFSQTGEDLLISDYDAVLNESISTTFSRAGIAVPLGASIGSAPATTITLTLNSLHGGTATTSLPLYYDFTFSDKSRQFGLFYSSESTEEPYLTYSTNTNTISYLVFGRATPSTDTITGRYTSAYTTQFTIGVLTTSSYRKISCDIISHTIHTQTTTAYTTSYNQRVTYFVGVSNSSSTDYRYGSYLEVGLSPVIRGGLFAPAFNSFSSQKALFGNFIKNVTDETAYWGLNIDSFGGIYYFSCYARRPQGGPNPRFFAFGNYLVNCPIDPISTSVENVLINQSVSSSLGNVTISQTVSYDSTFTTRSFQLSYLQSSGTRPFSFDSVVDFDSVLLHGAWAPDAPSDSIISPSPIVSPEPSCIFNTYGQMGGLSGAGYSASGAYFKSNSSSIEFVSDTYANPFSAESTVTNDNGFSKFSIYEDPDNLEPVYVPTIPLQQFQTYYV